MSIQINVDPNIQHLIQGFEKGINQFNARAASKAKLKVGIDEKSFTRPLGRITGQVNMFESAMEAANARVIAFGASTAVLASVTKVLKDIVKTSIEVEAAFADINRILGLTANQFEKFGNQLFDTAQKTASSFQAASAAALEFSRQGLKTEEVLKRTSDALTLVRLTGINAEKAVSLLTATVNAFTDLDTTSAVNKFVAVETKFAVAARDLVEGLSRVGSAAQDAKVDFDELNALITSVQQTTGRGGAVIGNALKTIFTRLQRESTLESLERFNVTVRDVQGNILPATQVLSNFAAQYDKLADSTQAYLREQVAGVFQANILSAILKDLNKEYSVTAKALDVSKNATNEAEQANFKLNQTLSALLQNTGTEFAKLQKTLGDEAFLGLAKSIVSSFGSVISGINNLLDPKEGSTIAKGFLKGFANVLQGPVLVGALKVLFNVAKQSFGFLTQALPVLLNITTASAKRAQTEEFINKLLSQDAKLAQQIFQAEGNQAKQLELVLSRAKGITNQFIAQSNLSSSIAKNLTSGGVYLTSSGVEGDTAKKIKNKAGGYMPSIRAEQGAISRGVGGAGNGAYPVVIPNFAFGGGKVGPVVANSSEVMVPNYGGSGGSAIFNQDMISRYGMPAGAVPIAAYGYNTKLSQVAKGNLASASKRNKNINPNDMLKSGYDAEFGFEDFPAFNDQTQYKSKKKYGEAYEDFVLNEFKTNLSGFSLVGNGKNWQSAHDFYRKDNSAIDLVKIVGNRITAMAEVKGGGLEKTQTLNKPSRFIGENLLDPRVGSMFKTPAGENVKVKTLLITNLNKPADTSGIVKGANGYIPYLAGGRMPLGSLASAANISSASAQNPNIHPEDLVKTGYDNHISLPIRSVMKRGMSPKVYGDKVEAEVAKNPKIKAMGYRLAHGGELYGNDNSAVDLIKTEGGILKGVMEVKGGELKAPAALKTGRVISENLSRPMVRGMFQGPPGEKIAYDTHLITNARRGIKPQNMAGMMRKGATMAGGYVPNFASGQIFGVSAAKSGGRLGGQNAKQLQSRFENIIKNMSQAGHAADAIKNQLMLTAQSSGLTAQTIKNLEPKFQSLSNSASKATASMNVVAVSASTLQKKIVKQKSMLERSPIARGIKNNIGSVGGSFALMSLAPVIGGVAEQYISGGKSRADQTQGQRFAGSAISGGLSGAVSGAMIGGLPGAVIGGLIGVGKAAYDSSLSLEELKQKADDYQKTTEANSSAAEQYIQAQKDIASALTQDELTDANKRAADAMKKLQESGSGLDGSFKEANGSITEMTASLLKYEKNRAAGSIGARLLASGENASDITMDQLANQFLDEFVDPSVYGQAGFKKRALEAAMSQEKLGYATSLSLDMQGQSLLGVDFDQIKAFKQGGFAEMNRQEKGRFMYSLLNQASKRKATSEKTTLTPEEQEIINFTAIKDRILIDVKKAQQSIKDRDIQKQFTDAMTNLQNSMLDGINAPIEKFNNMKSQIEADYANKVVNSADQFYADNAAKYADIFGKANKSQEGLAALTDFEAALKSGGDISGFDTRMRALFTEDEIIANPSIKAFFDNYELLVKENEQRNKTLNNEKTINQEKIRIEEIRAQNTKEELEAQREISSIQAQRRIADAQIAKQQADVNLALSRREFGLDMSVGLTGSQRIRESQSIAGARFRADVGDLNAKEQRDLERSFTDQEQAIAKARRETLGQVSPGDANYSAAYNDFVARQKEILDNAEAERKEIELQAAASREKFNEDYRQTNEKFVRELQKRGPSGIGLGLKEGMGQVKDDLETFQYSMTKEIPIKFRDGMASAMEATLDKTKDLKSALTDVAMDFMRIMRRQALENIVGGVMTLGAVPFKKQRGGVIKAQNGMYISGNRTGDRNPALLEDGEYVLNRNAVRALGGPSAIDRLNFGMAPRFKGGGAFLNQDVNLKSSGQMSSMYYASDDPLLKEMRDAAIAAEQRRQEKKAKKTALRNMIIQTAVSAVIGSAGAAMQGKFGGGASGDIPAELPEGYAGPPVPASGMGPYKTGYVKQAGGYISSGPRNIDSIPAFMAGGEFVMNNRAVRKYGLGFMSRINGGYIPGYQEGGSVAESAQKLGSSDSSNTNNISININMGSSGEGSSSTDGNQQSGSNDQKTKAKDLSERIKSVVLQVINEEQRTGGSLSKTKVAK